MPNPAKKMKKNKTGAIHSGGPGFAQTDVGRRIRVHWNPREAYDGVIDNFNPSNDSAHIQYDDGDEEWLNPLDRSAAETSSELLSPRQSCPGVTPKRIQVDDDENATPRSAEGEESSD